VRPAFTISTCAQLLTAQLTAVPPAAVGFAFATCQFTRIIPVCFIAALVAFESYTFAVSAIFFALQCTEASFNSKNIVAAFCCLAQLPTVRFITALPTSVSYAFAALRILAIFFAS
jgi:hypothetical protein